MSAGRIKGFFVFLAYSNILLALGSAMAAFSVSIIIGFPLTDIAPFAIIFSITFSIYNINRQTDDLEDRINHPDRQAFSKKFKKPLLMAAMIAYALAVILAFERGFETLVACLFPILIVGAYSIKWMPNTLRSRLKFSRLKDILIIKNLVIAFTWASMIFVLLSYYHAPVSVAVLTMFCFLFFRFLINTIMFDLRDTVGDKMSNVKTLPVVFGEARTKRYLYVLNAFLGVFLLAAAFFRLSAPLPLLFINISTLYGFYYISQFGKMDSKFLADVIVDGEYFFIVLLAIVSYLVH
jgi:4-hydroxybenzoate polyprenyltransferase